MSDILACHLSNTKEVILRPCAVEKMFSRDEKWKMFKLEDIKYVCFVRTCMCACNRTGAVVKYYILAVGANCTVVTHGLDLD